ncbi:MAG: transcription termination/antitermination protein NusG [Nitrospirota bacterium]|jgi:transcriptional antiterminator NusG
MAFKWYVVHTYSGFEGKVKASIEEQVRVRVLDQKISKILVPTVDIVELRHGKKRESKRKFFPGYILVEMHLDDEVWHLIKETPKVTGFVGGGGNEPPPLTDEEVRTILKQMDTGAAITEARGQFHHGDQVRIADGPFTSFVGSVEEVHPDSKRLKVMVSIFGRPTPVELEFLQVEKV